MTGDDGGGTFLPISGDVDGVEKTDGNPPSHAEKWTTATQSVMLLQTSSGEVILPPFAQVEGVDEDAASLGSEGSDQVQAMEEEDSPLRERILKRRAWASPRDTETDRPTNGADDGGFRRRPRRETGVLFCTCLPTVVGIVNSVGRQILVNAILYHS